MGSVAATMTGYLVVGTALLVAWVVAAPTTPLLYPPTLLAVLAAACGYALVAAERRELAALAEEPAAPDEARAKQRLVTLARCYRAAGPRGAEHELATATDPLERLGLILLADGLDPVGLDTALRRAADEEREADLAAARGWYALGRGAINGGVLVSLVQMAAAVSKAPPEQLQAAVSATFGATLYGLLLGWLVAQPQVSKRRRAVVAADRLRQLWIDGLVAVASGEPPRRLADRVGVSLDGWGSDRAA